MFAWVYFVANDCYYISSHRCSEFEYVRVDHSLCLVLGMMSPYMCGYLVIFRSLSKFNTSCLQQTDAISTNTISPCYLLIYFYDNYTNSFCLLILTWLFIVSNSIYFSFFL